MIFSILLLYFDDEAGLSRALSSALQQTGVRLEVLVIDYGPNKNTERLIHQVETTHGSSEHTVRYLECPQQSVNHARNQGLEAAQGDAILFLDTHSALQPDSLAQLMAAMETGKHDIVYGQVEIESQQLGQAYDSAHADYVTRHWHLSATLFSRTLLNRMGAWNTEIAGPLDLEFQARAKMHATSMQFLPIHVANGNDPAEDGKRIAALSAKGDFVYSIEVAANAIAREAIQQGVYTPRLSMDLAKLLYCTAYQDAATARHPIEGKRHILQTLFGLPKLNLGLRLRMLFALHPETAARKLPKYLDS